MREFGPVGYSLLLYTGGGRVNILGLVFHKKINIWGPLVTALKKVIILSLRITV